jgi:hypothetical protein
MSKKFFSADQERLFKVIGPMGKSLGHSSDGTHVAFVGGTGILPILDFVAYVARKVLLGDF